MSEKIPSVPNQEKPGEKDNVDSAASANQERGKTALEVLQESLRQSSLERFDYKKESASRSLEEARNSSEIARQAEPKLAPAVADFEQMISKGVDALSEEEWGHVKKKGEEVELLSSEVRAFSYDTDSTLGGLKEIMKDFSSLKETGWARHEEFFRDALEELQSLKKEDEARVHRAREIEGPFRKRLEESRLLLRDEQKTSDLTEELQERHRVLRDIQTFMRKP